MMAGIGGRRDRPTFGAWPNRSASFAGRDFNLNQRSVWESKVDAQETPFWAQPMAVGGGASAFSCFRERVKCSLGVNVQEKNRSRLVLKATDHQSDTLRADELKRILLEVRDARDARWLLSKLRERPVFSHRICAFKCLVVLQGVLQTDAAMDWAQLAAFLETLMDHWIQADSTDYQLWVDYTRVLQSKMEMLDRDSGCGKFSGTFSFSRSVAEPSDLLQALAMLLNYSEKLMPLALDVTQQAPSFGRLYLGAVVVILDEAWQLLCAVSVFVRDLLWQVHAAAKFGARDVGPEPPWLQLALHLLQAQPRFVKFHSAMCDFVAVCHELRSAGVPELAPPYVIPAVPQALLNLFADFKDLVAGYCARSEIAQSAPDKAETALPPNSQAAKVVASGDDALSALSTAVGSASVAGAAPSAASWPSAKVIDALRTVDSLQRSPLLATAERSVQMEEGADPSTKGYALLESEQGSTVVPKAGSRDGCQGEADQPGKAVLEGCDQGAPSSRNQDAAQCAPEKGLLVNHATPSWAAAICRHRDERRNRTHAEAPLFSTPLPWQPRDAGGVFPRADSPRKDAAVSPGAALPSDASGLAVRPALGAQIPPNPFAQKFPNCDVNEEVRGRNETPTPRCFDAPPSFVSPHGRPAERSKSPRVAMPWVQDLGEGARVPPSPQVQARMIPGRPVNAPRAARAQMTPPKVELQQPEDFSAAEWEVDPKELRWEELLGTGSTAEVYRAAWHGTDVAVKKLRSTGQLSTEFQREISVLLRLRHPNLVLFMGACTKAPQALIISEFCAGGTVFALLHQRKDLRLPWLQRLHIALDVAKGMNFLHRRQVVHRDLKSLNLLLAAPLRGPEDLPNVKVSDFGLSRAFPSVSAQQVCMTSGAGTYHWMAPEVLSGQSYDEKVDVYSYGICLYELITRRIPYDTTGLEPVSIAVAVSRGKRPDPKVVPQDCPADLRFTMKCCWAHRPSGRPGFDTILETLKLVGVKSRAAP